MIAITLDDLDAFAKDCYRRARRTADSIQLSAVRNKSFFSENYEKSATAQSMTDDPVFSGLDHFEGSKAWGAMLSFDMRRSSDLPKDLSARSVYVLMHTYLPTMLQVVAAAQGITVGLRGTGRSRCSGS